MVHGSNYPLASRSSKKHTCRILNVLLDLHQESRCLPSIDETMVICERQVHHRADLDFAVDWDCSVEDGVETDDGGLRWVDDWGRHEGSEDTAVADCEGSASKVLDGKFVVASL